MGWISKKIENEEIFFFCLYFLLSKSLISCLSLRLTGWSHFTGIFFLNRSDVSFPGQNSLPSLGSMNVTGTAGFILERATAASVNNKACNSANSSYIS